MELKENIEFLKALGSKLEQEVAVEDEAVKAYLVAGRERMAELEKKRERLYLIQTAVNNLSALVDESPEHEPVTADPWA